MGAYPACCQMEEEGDSLQPVQQGKRKVGSPILEDLWDLEEVAEKGKLRKAGGRTGRAKAAGARPVKESFDAISIVSMAGSVVASPAGDKDPGPSYNLEKQKEFASALGPIDPAVLHMVVQEAFEARMHEVRKALEDSHSIPLIAP